MDYLVMHQVEDRIYPDKQLVGTFFVADRLAVTAELEVRPLTFSHLCYALTRNHARLVYYNGLRCLWKLGFIRLLPGEAFSWRTHWRWFPSQKNRRWKG